MKRLAMVAYSACLWSAGLLPAAKVRLTPKTVVCFATPEEARDLLGTRDEFVRRMSPFDRTARMDSDRPVSERQFLQRVARSALPWEAEETDQIAQAISAIRPELNRLRLDFPEKVLMIKSAVGDAGAAHTRINAVILPETMVSQSWGIPEELLAHELLHILTRRNLKLRRSLYAVIGFHPCNEIELPQALKARKITNPDAPWNDAYITVSLDGQPIPVVPLLLSREEKYDRQKGRGLFGYLTLRLLAIEQAGGQWKPRYRDGKPILLEVGQVSGFHEQVGRNTAYTIHPEEIIADNFALLVTGKQNVPSPEILRKLREVLSKTQPQATETSARGPSTPPQ